MRHTARIAFTGLVIFLAMALVGCATGGSATGSSPAKKADNHPMAAKMEIYEVHHDGRIHVFYNKALYKEFMQLGETSYRLTRIGAGPNGETMVFGLTKKDKKLKKPVAAIELYDGKLKVDDFYAEMHKHGRIYVFNRFDDMQPVRDFGHPNFMHSKIGSGPNGETVVYVLNKKNKKFHPYALIAEFKKRNS